MVSFVRMASSCSILVKACFIIDVKGMHIVERVNLVMKLDIVELEVARRAG